jgi:uncharacterized protein
MAEVFADTFYYLARLSRNDSSHARAIEMSRELSSGTVTTAWVLTEVADPLHAPHLRGIATKLYDTLVADTGVTIVPAEQGLFERGWELYRHRPDKAWSFTDCISFVVMNDRNLREALTGDQHFEQAGFVALLR